MKRIFIDASKCDGCLNCSLACMQSHRETIGSIYDLDLTDKKNSSRNFILKDQLTNSYKPIFCRHCTIPECALSCMSGALTKNESTGLVDYDKDKCGSCYMCVMNCPYGVLKTDQANQYIIKCDLCQHQDRPSCVASCPKHALTLQEVSE